MLDKMSEERKPKILICLIEADHRSNYSETERVTEKVIE